MSIKIRPEITEPPQAITGQLYSPISLTCKAIGLPTPSIFWYKDNKLVSPNNDADPSILAFAELRLNDRSFYHCEARNVINGNAMSVNSSKALLNITSKK